MTPMDAANQARVDDQVATGQRIRAIEWNVKRLLGREGLDWEEPPADTGTPPTVLAALQSGNVIEAIKAYREATGVGLAEAKDAVERLRTGG